MKKIIQKLTLVILALFMLTSMGIYVYAAEVATVLDASSGSDYLYEELSNGTIVIIRYNGSDTVVTIPSSIGGKTVTRIGEQAFLGCSSLTSISLPDSVTRIEECVFEGCSSLTSISIPNKVTSIGDGAFGGCSSLTSISIPNKVTSIGYRAFVGCSSLTSISIPDSVTSIRPYIFAECSGLKNITIPDSVTSIGAYAFKNCSSLTSITIPSSMKSIGKYAFRNCSSLTSITISSGMKSIGKFVFAECSGLKSITIPNSVTSIGEDAFYSCYKLTSILIPDSVTSIGDGAFGGCGGLKSIKIPDSVTSIGKDAFYDCYNLTSITIPDSVTSIEDRVFGECSSLENITLPNSLTSIGNRAFCGCESLMSITIPDGVITIGRYAFEQCGLESITIPGSVMNIGDHAAGMGLKKPLSGYVIYCEKGSAAEEYAKTNGILYVATSSFTLSVPVLKSISNTTSGMKVSWQTAEGAEKYRLYYKNESGLWIKAGDTTLTSCTVPASKLTSGSTYTFTVRCVSANGNLLTSNYDTTGISMIYLSPLIAADLKLGNVVAGVKVSWKSVEGAEGYIISRRPETTTKYTEIARVTDSSTFAYTDTTAVSGTKYYYNVRAYNGADMGGYYGRSILALGAVVKDDMTISNLSSGLKISWKQITGAEGYSVYRKSSSESDYTKIGTVTSGTTVTYTDTVAVNGMTYTYRVRAYNGTTLGSYYGKTAMRLTTPSITSLMNVATAKMTVKWESNSKATGYQIRYSTNIDMPSGSYTTVTVTSASAVSKTIASLTKGKTYYVKMRSYKTEGTTKYYSGWSTKKSVKISN